VNYPGCWEQFGGRSPPWLSGIGLGDAAHRQRNHRWHVPCRLGAYPASLLAPLGAGRTLLADRRFAFFRTDLFAHHRLAGPGALDNAQHRLLIDGADARRRARWSFSLARYKPRGNRDGDWHVPRGARTVLVGRLYHSVAGDMVLGTPPAQRGQ